jgi:TonB family protein
MACCALLTLTALFPSEAQQPAQPEAAQQPVTFPAQSGEDQKPAAPQTQPAAETAKVREAPHSQGISEAELKQMLAGKTLYLRGCYLDNTLKFDEYGRLIGHSPQGSYTLNAIEIDKVRLTKRKVELEGIRYGLHFEGQLASEDPSTAFDRVRITPKKKAVLITVDREIVVKPKKEKGVKSSKQKNKRAGGAAPPATPSQPATEPAELSEADQLKASIAAAPQAERPAGAKSMTTTTSPAHATKLLKEALDNIFAQGLDERMIAAMPDFWRLYYEAAAAKSDYRPKDPAILRQNAVDRKARLLTQFEPDSNEYAQANGVAGMALYHTVIGPDGKVQEIAVARPIGFGLDENAVAAIRQASFQPAEKDGKPVPVLLDLVVQFRIFDKRTASASAPGPSNKPAEPVLPGPYSVQHP